MDRSSVAAAVGRELVAGALVTLIGPGGIGKTHLASAIAAGRDHVVVDASTATTAGAVLRATADALGLPTEGALLADATVVGRVLADRGVLVVLDAAEGAAPQLRAVVDAWQEAAVLVTSRIPLGAERERLVEVPPLDLAAGSALFLSRADPQVVRDHAEAIAAIVDAVGGNPLAIELAAGRTALAAPPQILAALRRDPRPVLRDLAGRHSARHASLVRVVADSFGLLTPERRAELRTLACFAGWFWAEGAEAVGVGAVSLVELCRWSLVRREVEPDRVRFRLFDEVRLWLRDAHPPDTATTARVAAHVVHTAEALGSRLGGRGSGRAAVKLATWIPDLEAVVARARPELAGRALLVLTRALSLRHAGEAVRLLEEVGDPGDALPPRERATLLAIWARALRRQGRVSDGLVLLDGALDHPPDPVFEGLLRAERASLFTYRSRKAEAVAEARAAVALLAHLDDNALTHAQRVLGTALRVAGEDDEAGQVLQEALGRAGLRGDHHGQINCLSQLMRLPNLSADEIQALATRALALTREAELDPRTVGVVLSNLTLSMLPRDRQRGIQMAVEAAAAARAAGDLDTQVNVESRALLAMVAHDPPSDTRPQLERALELARRTGVASQEAGLLYGMGVAAHRDGDLPAAIGWYERAVLRAAQTHREVDGRMARCLLALAVAERGGAPQPTGDAPTDAALAVWAGAPPDRLIEALAQGPGVLGGLLRPMLLRVLDGRGAWRFPSDGSAFVEPSGRTIPLGRRRAARRVLAALVEVRLARPGEAVDPEALIAAGWPGERMRPDSARERLYTTVRDLRNLGLDALIETTGEGYRLDPSQRVSRSESS